MLAMMAGCADPETPPAVTSPQIEGRRAVAQRPDPDGPLRAYRGATFIDGTGSAAIDNATIVVQGQRILAAGAGVAVPDGTEEVDVSGKWVVPGLIDAHIHIMTSGRAYTRPAMVDLQHVVPYEEEIDWIESHVPDTLRSMLCAGVTGAISMGGPSIEYRAREKARQMAAAPTLFIGHGPAVPFPGFLAEQFFPRWHGEMTLKPVTSPAEGATLVRDAAGQQADLVKTVVDDRGRFLFALLMKWVGWESVLDSMIAEAAGHDLPVTTHVHQLEPARKLLDMGVHSLQHLPSDQPIDQDFAASAREKQVIVVPTLALYQRTFDELYSKDFNFLPIEQHCGVPDVIQSWYEPLPGREGDASKLTLQGQMAAANTQILNEAGVSLAAGTDAGLMGLVHGPAMHLELRALRRAGLTPSQLIVAATLNAAKSAGRARDYGSIEPGKFADFLVLSQDPLADIANLQAIETVVKHGKPFRQDELLPRPAKQ